MTGRAADALQAAGPRPRQAGALSASLAFAWRALLKLKHMPEQLGDVIGIPLVFTVLFTYLFGGALAGSTADYLQFLLPGTLTLAVVFVTVYSGVTLNRDLATGAFDRFRSLPIWRLAPIVGALIGDVGRYLLAASLVIGVGLIMGFHADGGPAGVLAAVALAIAFSSALSWMWIALGLLLRTPNAVMSIGFIVLFPLAFMSNIFVQPHTLPTWLRVFAQANPISQLATADRGLMEGSADLGAVLRVLVASTVLLVLFVPLSAYLYRRHG